MNRFKKWNKKHIEDCGSYMGDDAKNFYRDFKRYLKRTFPDAELIGFRPNHYDFSGFLSFSSGVVIYVSHSLRTIFSGDYCVVDFSSGGDWIGGEYGVLFRTAKDVNDFRGGVNNYSSINDLEKNIRHLESIESRKTA